MPSTTLFALLCNSRVSPYPFFVREHIEFFYVERLHCSLLTSQCVGFSRCWVDPMDGPFVKTTRSRGYN